MKQQQLTHTHTRSNTHTTQVKEMRSLITAYLTEMERSPGAEMEMLLVAALEASDMLDTVLTLQKVCVCRECVSCEGLRCLTGKRHTPAPRN